MTLKEAIEAMFRGEKIRHVSWMLDFYLFWDGEKFMGSDKNPGHTLLQKGGSFEIYKVKKEVKLFAVYVDDPSLKDGTKIRAWVEQTPSDSIRAPEFDTTARIVESEK